MATHFLFIVNPNAGKGKAMKEWQKIEKRVRRHKVKYHSVLTNAKHHAYHIIQEKIKQGFKSVIVVGGDGSLNEAVNGIFSQEHVPPSDIALGMIPVGTGNDWARYYDLPKNYHKALGRIFNQQPEAQDVGRITYHTENGLQTGYFMNIAGFGFDALVVKSTNELQSRGNRLGIAYLFNLIRCLSKYRSMPMKVQVNGDYIDEPVFSISIGNGRYSGGGMKQTPHARIDDGMFDVTVYTQMSSWKVLRNVHRLYNGKIARVKGVKTYRCRHLSVVCEGLDYAEIDGELVGASPYDIDIIPAAVKVFN